MLGSTDLPGAKPLARPSHHREGPMNRPTTPPGHTAPEGSDRSFRGILARYLAKLMEAEVRGGPETVLALSHWPWGWPCDSWRITSWSRYSGPVVYGAVPGGDGDERRATPSSNRLLATMASPTCAKGIADP
jgi:hypothetical protein